MEAVGHYGQARLADGRRVLLITDAGGSRPRLDQWRQQWAKASLDLVLVEQTDSYGVLEQLEESHGWALVLYLGTHFQDACRIDKWCGSHELPFIWAVQFGFHVAVFVNARIEGPNPEGYCHENRDVCVFVSQILKTEDRLLVCCFESHGLQSGDEISFDWHKRHAALKPLASVQLISDTQFEAVGLEPPHLAALTQLCPDEVGLRLVRKSSRVPNLEDRLPLEQSGWKPVFSGGCGDLASHAAVLQLASGLDLSHIVQKLGSMVAPEQQSSFCERVRAKMAAFGVPWDLRECVVAVLVLDQVVNALVKQRFPCLHQWVHFDLDDEDFVQPPEVSGQSAPALSVCLNGLHNPLCRQLVQDVMALKEQVVAKLVVIQDAEESSGPAAMASLQKLAVEKEFTGQMVVLEHGCLNLCSSPDRATLAGHQMDVLINACGSSEQRKCVADVCQMKEVPLLDCGCDHRLGHVQSVVPHHTELLTAVADPVEEPEPPYCVIRSFPQNGRHCLAWAVDKMQHLLRQKPQAFNQFFLEQQYLAWQPLASPADDCVPVDKKTVITYKMLSSSCHCWSDCVALARSKFHKYFEQKALTLLHLFPPDSGDTFWAYPKRRPQPVVFCATEPLHLNFVRLLGRCFAALWEVPPPTSLQLHQHHISQLLTQAPPPQPPPELQHKVVITDESVTKTEAEQGAAQKVDFAQMAHLLAQNQIQNLKYEAVPEELLQEVVQCASQLRCAMYRIPIRPQDIRLQVQPSAKCQTNANLISLISQLVCVEVQKRWLFTSGNGWRGSNYWISLVSQPMVLRSRSGCCQKTPLGRMEVSVWDKLHVFASPQWTLQHLIQHLETRLPIQVGMLVQASRMIYVHFLPGQQRKLTQTMVSLLKPDPDVLEDVILNVISRNADTSQESLPPVVYHFRQC